MKMTKRDLQTVFSEIIEKYRGCEKEINQCVEKINNHHIDKVDFYDQMQVILQQIKTAKNKFTIATIGEFKAGKSTTINTILKIHGDEGLSCQFEPDTAKAIRIMKKEEGQQYNAEIVFYEETGFPVERMSWDEAKKYTSQVELDNNPSLRKRAGAIDEVRYYIDNDILESCNFLDLPGTGFDPYHNRITEEKIKECDAVFWILSNTEEPNNETIKNLQMIKHKIIPVVNVWYDEGTEEEIGDLTFEEVKSVLSENFKVYLGDNEIIKYNAKAIEKMQLNDEEFPEGDSFGYDEMVERLTQLVYGEGKDLEVEKKQRMIENTLESCSFMEQKIKGLVSEIKKFEEKLNMDMRENALIKRKIEGAYSSNQTELKGLASNAVDEIISRMNEASELFINDKMATPKISMTIKLFTKKGKEKLFNEFESEYGKKYLEIDNWEEKDTWVDAVANDFRDDMEALFANEYMNAGIEPGDLSDDVNSDIRIEPKFFSSIGENMSIVFEQLMKENLPVILSCIFYFIPGYEIVDMLFMLSSLTGKIVGKNEDKLEKRVEQAKRRARLSISFQRLKLVEHFKKVGKSYNSKYKQALLDSLDVKNGEIDMLAEAIDSIYKLQDDMEEYMKELQEEFAANGGI